MLFVLASFFSVPTTAKVIRVGFFFYRSNRRRAIRVGFSSKCYPTIPASRLGYSRLDQRLELAHVYHSTYFHNSILIHHPTPFLTLQYFLLYTILLTPTILTILPHKTYTHISSFFVEYSSKKTPLF